MDKQTQRLVSQGVFATVALTMAGLLLGLKRLIWGLWILVSSVWILVWLNAMSKNPHTAPLLYLATAFVPPVILFVIVRVLSAVADGIRGVAMMSPLPLQGVQQLSMRDTPSNDDI